MNAKVKIQKIERRILPTGNAGEGQQCRQAFGEALEAVVATGLDTQGTSTVIALGVAIVQGFIGGLQPHLIAVGIGRGRDFQFGQGLNVIVGQFPGFTAVMVALGAQVTVEMLVRGYRRVDQKGLEAMAIGQMGGIVAAERTAHQQWRTQFGDGRFELDHGLPWMVVQGRHSQLVGQAELLHDCLQLTRLGRKRRAVEAMDIEDGTRHAAPESVASRLIMRAQGRAV